MEDKEELNEEEFSLEDILKEFGGGAGEEPEAPADEPEEAPEPEEETREELPEEETAPDSGETVRFEPPVTSDTVRLENVAAAVEKSAMTEDTVRFEAVPQDTVRLDDIREAVSQAEEQKNEEEAFSGEWEPDYDAPMGDYVPQEPIVIRPKSRLWELKKELVNGPEKRYYELSELGVGKLQVAMVLNLLVVLLSAGATVLYGMNLVQPERMKLMIFGQVLAMLVSALLGSGQMIEGAADLLKKKFTLNTMLLVTFMACCADGVLCLSYEKVPCCAAFSLEVGMSLWSAYHKRVTETGQMDTLRKATRLDGLVMYRDYYEGTDGILRKQCQLEDFMEVNTQVPGPERVMQTYSLIALGASLAIGLTAGIFHSPVLGVRALAASLLVAVPATSFITNSRPAALLEQRLHRLGSVICGWRGVAELSRPAAFPLTDTDLFPAGSTRMNGVKFFGDRDPDEIMAYTTAVISAGGGGLTPLFNQLLDSRNGYHYEVENLRFYGNGGIGGEVNGEPVLVGVQPFLQDMGVEIPEGTRVSQAVYVAIDGELGGVFAVTYGKNKSSAAGFTTLGSYRKLTPVLLAGDFMLTESFLRSKFSASTRRVVFPEREDRAALAAREPREDAPVLAMTTREGLAPMAFAVTGARALRTAGNLGTGMHMLAGVIGLAMMAVLAVLGAEALLTPVNMLLYQLLWMIPGLLISEWTRSV